MRSIAKALTIYTKLQNSGGHSTGQNFDRGLSHSGKRGLNFKDVLKDELAKVKSR